jgi:hypothetical protein
MKKVIFLGAFALVSLASCKKEYTCTCTGYVDGAAVSSASTTIKDTKSDAQTTCDSGDTAASGGVSVNCEIK